MPPDTSSPVFAGDKKVGRPLLYRPERALVAWGTPRVPRWLETYHLTLLTLVWSGLNAVFGVLAQRDLRWFWGVWLGRVCPERTRLKRLHEAMDDVPPVIAAEAGGAETVPFPEGAATGVGLKHGEIEVRGRGGAGKAFDMGQKAGAEPVAAQARGKDHQAQISVACFGKAEAQFGKAR